MADDTPQPHELIGPFRAWVDAALAQDIPHEVRAFCFNLYETGHAFGVELIGAPAFDASNPDWACEEVFEYREGCLEIPIGVFGGAWAKCLQAITQWVCDYLETGDHASELKSRDGVAVGFVDGDLNVVWNALVEGGGRRTRG
jgi:hypothetical protein